MHHLSNYGELFRFLEKKKFDRLNHHGFSFIVDNIGSFFVFSYYFFFSFLTRNYHFKSIWTIVSKGTNNLEILESTEG